MNRPRQRPRSQQRRSGARPPADIWRPAAPLPEVEPITPADDPSALVRSLGEPPVATGEAALHRFATVVERSAAIATALAISAGALDTGDADDGSTSG